MDAHHGRLITEKESMRQLVLYAADTPNSWKVAALLEELGVDYDVINVAIMQNEQKETKYVGMNPNGRTPTLLDRSVSPPFAVFESNAILIYLADKFKSALLPHSPTGRSEVEQWLMWQISALGPMLGQCMYMKRIATCSNEVSKVQFSIDRFHAESVRLLKVLDAHLTDRDYICGQARGEYSLADLACFGYAACYWWAGISIDDMPSVRRWLDLLFKRPALVRGMRVPGVPLLGPTSILFEQMISDASIRLAIERSALNAGRPDFNWLDVKAISNLDGGAVFVSDASPSPSNKTIMRRTFGIRMVGAAFVVGFLLGSITRR